jgi:hypothetical protein
MSNPLYFVPGVIVTPGHKDFLNFKRFVCSTAARVHSALARRKKQQCRGIDKVNIVFENINQERLCSQKALYFYRYRARLIPC